MKSITVCFRLNSQEFTWINRFSSGEGYSDRSEWLRAIIHREALKRGLKPDGIKPCQWDTDNRNGRPKDNCNTL